MVKNLPATQGTLVQSLGWEDPLENGMAILSSILAGKIPQTEELGGLQSMGSQRVRHDLVTEDAHTHRVTEELNFSFFLILILKQVKQFLH